MGKLNSKFEKCLKKGKLVKAKPETDLIEKELKEAELDLASAGKSIKEKNPKWTTVQAYYSMFHSARALVLSKGYREKSHYCLLIALGELFVSDGILEKKYANLFRDSMNLREDADYGMIYSEETAGRMVADAESFLKEAKRILKAK
ncbi:MAG: HEPN domain-containing protein [Candidatus Micrarchaeota archaeon]